MGKIKYAACEYNFPIWGSLALEMAAKAGFDGIEITDGGGYLQPHPMNTGLFVEYERLALNLVRLDGFPLLDPIIQEDYKEAVDKTGIEITGVYLYFLNNQGFVNSENGTLQGKDCLKTIENAIKAAAQMNIPLVSVPTKGMFGVAKNAYALQKLEFAVKCGKEYGVAVANSFDTSLAREIEVIEKAPGLQADFYTVDPMINAREDATEMIRALGKDKIRQFKIKDLKADAEGLFTKETSGDALFTKGDFPIEPIVSAIKEIGYEGWIVSDTPYNAYCLNEGKQKYVELATEDLGYFKKAFEG